MKVDKIVTQGTLQQNCYILSKGNQCLVIDPGSDYHLIREKIASKELLGILITHHHFDHVGALDSLKRDLKGTVYEFPNLEEKNYQVGDFSFSVIFTPGHSKDSVTYYFSNEQIMFTGDFLFQGTVGRCDFEGGSFLEMQQSLNKMKEYSDSIVVYPGHEEQTTLEIEKRTNPYLID